MKLLFERLSHEIDWDMKDAVRESVSQLTATAMLENRDVPPGILNFGVPHVVELGPGDAALERYGNALAQRIYQFEPRLKQVAVDVVDGQLQISAQLRDQVEESVTWRLGE
jgi:predicted component of type VI protein secretion system